MSRQPLYEQAKEEKTNQHWRPECKEIIQLYKEIHPWHTSQCIAHAEEISKLQRVQWNKHVTFRFLSKLYLYFLCLIEKQCRNVCKEFKTRVLNG